MMNCPHCQGSIELKSIPEAALKSEWARRTRARSSGIWKHHNPNPNGTACLCADCKALRAAGGTREVVAGIERWYLPAAPEKSLTFTEAVRRIHRTRKRL